MIIFIEDNVADVKHFSLIKYLNEINIYAVITHQKVNVNFCFYSFSSWYVFIDEVYFC